MGSPSPLILLVILTGAAGQTPPQGQLFNCLRPGISCTDGTCNDDGLGCTCNEGHDNFLDYHCVNEDYIMACTTEESKLLDCKNDGVCRKLQDSTTFCLCSQLYVGKLCEDARIAVQCDTDSMTVIVRPHGTFGGKMFAKGKAEDPNCALQPTDTRFDKYTAKFSYTATDASHCGIEMIDHGDSNYLYLLKVIVKYDTSDTDIITSTDQELDATCSYSNFPSLDSGRIFDITAQNVLDRGSASDSGAPAELKVLDGYDSEIPDDGSVQVGDDLKIRISLHNPIYKGLKVEVCAASNMEDRANADYVEIYLVDLGGCPSQASVMSGSHVLQTSPNIAIDVPFKAFMFSKGSDDDNSNDLFITCDIRVCNDADNTAGFCKAPEASACTGLRRKKRSSDEDSVTLSRKLTVRFGQHAESGVRSDQTGLETDTGKCLKNPEMQTVISVLGVLLLALIVAVIVLTFIVCRRSRYSGKQVDDSHTMGSSTQTLSNHEHRMHIPRPDY